MTYAKDAIPPFYHGTRANLSVGDTIATGYAANNGDLAMLSWVYFTARLETAIWGCELAAGAARERIYIVEPTAAFEDDPNLTDKKFPGNPTASYRSRAPLLIVGEVETWEPHAPEVLQAMKDGLAALRAKGEDGVFD